MSIDYKSAGVDIEAGESLVSWLKTEQPSQWPHQDRLVEGIGGFAALFRANFPEMKSPCLVSATDGVGTKLKLAVQFEQYAGLGQDLVAMCVNDLICCGAQPLFFLDYYATGKLQLPVAKSFLSGLKNACIEANCALIGGETAEMPGVYHQGDFDCAGFAVGIVDEEKTLGRHRVKEGDCVIGVSSSGFHSNGFSLLRQVFAEDAEEYKEVLLTPTALYVKLVHALLQQVELHALAHITGGGMDNLNRVLPQELSIKVQSWQVPEIFSIVRQRTEMTTQKMLQTLNCGIGFCLVLPEAQKQQAIKTVQDMNFQAFDLGILIADSAHAGWWMQDKELEALL